MFGRAFFGGRFWAPRYFGGGGDAAPVVIAETFSGGWGRPTRRWPAEESDSARKARIHAERVKLGILPSAPAAPAAVEGAGGEIAGVPAALVWPELLDPALAEELARLHTSAYLDQEIARHFELQDEDDAAVLLLAIATLH